MEQVYNRVEAEFKQWIEKENRVEKLIPGTLEHNRPFLKEKLHFLENLQVKYAGGLSGEERLMLRVLDREKGKLATKLYPNRLVRLLRNLFSAIRLLRRTNTYNTLLSGNTAELGKELSRSGFGGLDHKITEQIKQGKPEFSIPVSYYPRENERLDIDLVFQRKETGEYKFRAGAAKLTNTETKLVRSHSFATDQLIKYSQQETANLLSGRPVLPLDGEAPWKNGKWVQFDLNDKDAQGNYRIREKEEDLFDVVKTIRDLGIRQKHTGLTDEKLLQMARQGEPINITVSKKGTDQSFKLELNPFQKSVSLYDAKGNKVSAEEVLKTNNVPSRVVVLKPNNSSLNTKQVKQQKRI